MRTLLMMIDVFLVVAAINDKLRWISYLLCTSI